MSAEDPGSRGQRSDFLIRLISLLEAEGLPTALSVMAGLVPAIHAAPFRTICRQSGGWTTWMTGTSPVMTVLPSFSIRKGLDAERCGFKKSIV